MANAMKNKYPASRLKGLKPIKKGEVRNPTGNNGDPEILAIKRLTVFELKDLGSSLVRKDISELKRIAHMKTGVSWIVACTAKIAWKALENGDDKRYEAILQRIIGKVPIQAEISGPGGGPIVQSNLTEAELLKHELALKEKLKLLDDE